MSFFRYLDETIRFIFNIQIRGFVGQLDQLEDRLLCKQEVVGSNPTLSTHFIKSVCRGFNIADSSSIPQIKHIIARISFIFLLKPDKVY